MIPTISGSAQGDSNGRSIRVLRSDDAALNSRTHRASRPMNSMCKSSRAAARAPMALLRFAFRDFPASSQAWFGMIRKSELRDVRGCLSSYVKTIIPNHIFALRLCATPAIHRIRGTNHKPKEYLLWLTIPALISVHLHHEGANFRLLQVT